MITYTFIAIAILILAVVSAIFLYLRYGRSKLASASLEASRIIEEAKRNAENSRKAADIAAKEHWYQEKVKFEKETASRRKEIERAEKRLSEKERVLDRHEHLIVDREKELMTMQHDLQNKERIIHAKSERFDQMIREQNEALQKIANLSKDDAKAMLMRNLEAEARHEAASLINQIKEEAKAKAEESSREVLLQVIQRCATAHTADTTISVVPIPSDEMKGRIIGREGRNIRAFENLTGVEVVIDDTPEMISLSCFDPIRREVARISMEKLITDGRIHPSRIEDVVQTARKEIEGIIKNTGEEVVLELGIIGVAPEIVKYLGKMKYRTSYGQNLLQHSREVASLSAGLLHDLGKVADGTLEGSHAHIGSDIAGKFGEGEIVANAIAAHHEEAKPMSPYAAIVEIADSISGSRPGARRETIEAYIKRLNTLEELASSFDGVERVFAIQAGREIRVMVHPEKISDIEAESLAHDIARRIEKETQYPGQIKVTVIREKRVVETAK
jgi:ribonuclease Y